MNEKLVKILTEARHNPNLKQKLIDTKSAKDPMQAFCEVATEAGYPIRTSWLPFPACCGCGVLRKRFSASDCILLPKCPG